MADTFIQLIADYGIGDPAFGEVIQKLKSLDLAISVHPIAVPKFSTIATGVWIAQMATVNAYKDLIVYSNTAPRKILPGFTEEASFGKLAYTKLENGVHVIAVHSGYAFSFLKPSMKEFYLLNVSNAGTQFRSRDNYPEAVIAIAHGDMSMIGDAIPLSAIPDAPNNRIGFIDGYGNIKTTMRRSQCTFPEGAKINVSCNGKTWQGVVAFETYHVRDGEVSFAPGSTGGNDRFMEIWVRGESAWDAFDRPEVEAEFRVEKVE